MQQLRNPPKAETRIRRAEARIATYNGERGLL